ncbi:hypothetical protein, partial [Kutzneria kofuensis]|uniref:hypothetical protein n=1 Tax=Kutzneria kofuensis TaxID=103725 RepID=UPI0031E54467
MVGVALAHRRQVLGNIVFRARHRVPALRGFGPFSRVSGTLTWLRAIRSICHRSLGRGPTAGSEVIGRRGSSLGPTYCITAWARVSGESWRSHWFCFCRVTPWSPTDTVAW